MKCECSTTLCAEHQQSFLDILADVPGRLATMMVSVAKQSVMGGQGGSPKNDDDRPLPVNIGASDARLTLRGELLNVVVRVQHCLGERPRYTELDIPGVCVWLARLMPRIVQHPEAVDWYHRILRAYEQTTKAIDLPPERIRAGKCTECNEVLYTVAGHEKVRCRPCGISYLVWELQTLELSQVRNYRGTATEVLRVLRRAEIKIRLTRLTKWADRRQVPFTTEERGRIFTVGNVLDTYELMEGTK